jgi:transposase
MSYRQGEVLGRIERRRQPGAEVAVLAEACAPGAVISDVAHRHGLLPSQVFKWRRLAALGVIGIPGASDLPSFVAVEVAADAAAEPPTRASEAVGEERAVSARTSPGVIEIELGSGRCVRVVGEVDAEALRRVLDVLDRR